MSWQDYVDKNLMASGCMKHAGIFGMDGNPWALSAGFAPDQGSICQLVGILRSKQPYGDGVTLAGCQYMVLAVEEEEGTCVLIRKNLPPNADEGQKYAAIIAVTNQAVIIGMYLGGHANSGTTKKFVCNLQSYLRSVNY